MTLQFVRQGGVMMLLVAGLVAAFWPAPQPDQEVRSHREEVVFWHFWGGDDRKVVDEIIRRFHASQDKYYVRAVAMPGNNLDLKFFLAVTGGTPPDLLNLDDPIIADWASRGALTPLDELASPDELKQLDAWLFPAAKRLAQIEGRYYSLPNGLDVRALYYNRTLLEEHAERVPTTLAELDRLADVLSATDDSGRRTRFGYLPDSRRLWAWGIVFGGRFQDPQTGEVTIDDPKIVAALKWMASYRERYTAREIRQFRTGDQSLPGKPFPLLEGRYGFLMDGQWRVRDIAAFNAAQRERGEAETAFGVCPLPPPPGGLSEAGWVNGNFFVVPRGAPQSAGAWAFMKFWSGFGHEAEAAKTCVAGGWIPVSQRVVDEPPMQAYLRKQPLFAKFVELAGSPNQVPVPAVRGALQLNNEVKAAGELALLTDDSDSPAALLQRIQEKALRRLRDRLEAGP